MVSAVSDSPTPPAAPVAPVAPVQASLPLVAPPPVDQSARLRAELDAERAKLSAEVEAARKAAADEVARVRAEADARVLEVEASSMFRSLGVVRPDHALRLMGDRLAVVNGKVVDRADPTRPALDTIKAWIETEGRYMLAPSIPSGGSGAPAAPAAPKAQTPTDLSTPDGRKAYVASGFLAALRRPSTRSA